MNLRDTNAYIGSFLFEAAEGLLPNPDCFSTWQMTHGHFSSVDWRQKLGSNFRKPYSSEHRVEILQGYYACCVEFTFATGGEQHMTIESGKERQEKLQLWGSATFWHFGIFCFYNSTTLALFLVLKILEDYGPLFTWKTPSRCQFYYISPDFDKEVLFIAHLLRIKGKLKWSIGRAVPSHWKCLEWIDFIRVWIE